MRAISIRSARLRRNSTSLTLISNLAAGSYAVRVLALAARADEYRRQGLKAGTTTGRPAAPNAVIVLRKSRRPGRYSFMLASKQDDREPKGWLHYLTHKGTTASGNGSDQRI